MFPCGSGREPAGPPRWNRCAWREWREAKVTQQRELANGHSGPWPRFPGAVGPCCSAKPRAMLFASAGSAPACQTTPSARDFVFLDVLQGGERPPPPRAGHGLRPPHPFQPHLKKAARSPARERESDLGAHVAQRSPQSANIN